MYTLLIILVVISVLGSIYVVAGKYKEKFGRNFIFNKCSWGILIGEIIALISFGSAAEIVPDEHAKEFFLSMFTLGILHSDIFTGEYSLDLYSGFFAFGLICFFSAWYINIKKSSFVWGMVQNVLQTIIVTVFSVLIVVVALFIAEQRRSSKSA